MSRTTCKAGQANDNYYIYNYQARAFFHKAPSCCI